MKKTKAFIVASLMLLISDACLAQNNQKEKTGNQLTITGITGQSTKGSPDEKTVGKLIDNISDQILEEKLTAKSTGNLSYMLNSKEFIVNGVVQDSEIHLRYKNKYIKDNTTWNICKNYKMK